MFCLCSFENTVPRLVRRHWPDCGRSRQNLDHFDGIGRAEDTASPAARHGGWRCILGAELRWTGQTSAGLCNRHSRFVLIAICALRGRRIETKTVIYISKKYVNIALLSIYVTGFGRSSRPNFSADPMGAEKQLVKSIEEWRREMNLPQMILLGHSMGGFLATSYTMSYPDRWAFILLFFPTLSPAVRTRTHTTDHTTDLIVSLCSLRHEQSHRLTYAPCRDSLTFTIPQLSVKGRMRGPEMTNHCRINNLYYKSEQCNRWKVNRKCAGAENETMRNSTRSVLIAIVYFIY